MKPTLSANPDIGVKALKTTIQHKPGVLVSVSTATRACRTILLTVATEVANSYHDLPGYFRISPTRRTGSVFHEYKVGAWYYYKK